MLFEHSGRPYAPLNDSFSGHLSNLYRNRLMLSTILFVVVNLIGVAYDYHRFFAEEDSVFYMMLGLRVGVMIPTCALILLFVQSKAYFRHMNRISFGILVVGLSISAYAVLGNDPGYGTLSIFLVYVFSFTPLSFYTQLALNGGILFVFSAAVLLFDDFTDSLNVVAFVWIFLVVVALLSRSLRISMLNNYLHTSILTEQQLRLRKEKNHGEDLLASMLPKEIIEELKSHPRLIARSYTSVTVGFIEISHFNDYARKLTPSLIVQLLNLIYSEFDAQTDAHDVYKVETVGEIFMFCAGVPEVNPTHACEAANFSLSILDLLPTLRKLADDQFGELPAPLEVRIGLNSGPIVAGVVGLKNPRFKLFGDTVNTASRMESTGLLNSIQVTPTTYRILRKRYDFNSRGKIPVKGKGMMEVYLLMCRKESTPQRGHSLRPLKPDLVVFPESDSFEPVPQPLPQPMSVISVSLPKASPAKETRSSTKIKQLGGRTFSTPDSPSPAESDLPERKGSLPFKLTHLPQLDREKSFESTDSGHHMDLDEAVRQGIISRLRPKSAYTANDSSDTEDDAIMRPKRNSLDDPKKMRGFMRKLQAFSVIMQGARVGRSPTLDLESGLNIETRERLEVPSLQTLLGPKTAPSNMSDGDFEALPPGEEDSVHEVEITLPMMLTHGISSCFPNSSVWAGAWFCRALSRVLGWGTVPVLCSDTSHSFMQGSMRSLYSGSVLPREDSAPNLLSSPAGSVLYDSAMIYDHMMDGDSATGKHSFVAKKISKALSRSASRSPAVRVLRRMKSQYFNNRPALLEEAFQDEHYDRWLYQLQITLVGTIFGCILYDLVSLVVRDPKDDRWSFFTRSLMAGVAVATLLLSLKSKWFKENRFALITIPMLMFFCGLIAVIAMEEDPGYGVVALVIIYSYHLLIIPLLVRVVAFLAVILAYGGALYLFNDYVTPTDILLHMGYLFVFVCGQAVPAFHTEKNLRVIYFNKRALQRQTRALGVSAVLLPRLTLFQKEKEKTSSLLKNLLPENVVNQLLGGSKVIAERFPSVSILFSDLRGFTAFSSTITPQELVVFLNSLYSAFDRLIDRHGLYKVEVIGDAYFVVGGCPKPDCCCHAYHCAMCAMKMIDNVEELRQISGTDIQMRVGLHTGPVVAGVVGSKDPRYHLFGDTVKIAMAMESSGIPDKVQCSPAIYKLLTKGFNFERRDETVAVDEDTTLQTYILRHRRMSKFKIMQKEAVKSEPSAPGGIMKASKPKAADSEELDFSDMGDLLDDNIVVPIEHRLFW